MTASGYIGQGFPLNLKREDGTSTPVLGWAIFDRGGKIALRPLTLDDANLQGGELDMMNQLVYVTGGTV